MQTNQDIERIKSPLQELVNSLKDEFPNKTDSIYSEIDEFQCLGRELEETIYISSIYNLSRRLVIHAQYAATRATTNDTASIIRESLTRNFKFTNLKDPNRILMLAYECYKSSQKTPTDSTIKSIKKQSKENASVCYICGVELSHDDQSAGTYIEVEHQLPRSLGGGNDNTNLLAACKTCNKFKRNRISGADLHFESIVYPHTEQIEHKIEDFQLFAARFFNQHKCSNCGESAEDIGTLHVLTSQDDLEWNLFNITLLCNGCAADLNIDI